MRNSTENKLWECFQDGDFAQARKILKSHYRRNKRDAATVAMIAYTYQEQRQYEQALEWSDKAMAIQPNAPYVLWLRVSILRYLDRETEALKILITLLDWAKEKIDTKLSEKSPSTLRPFLEYCCCNAVFFMGINDFLGQKHIQYLYDYILIYNRVRVSELDTEEKELLYLYVRFLKDDESAWNQAFGCAEDYALFILEVIFKYSKDKVMACLIKAMLIYPKIDMPYGFIPNLLQELEHRKN